MSAPFSGIEVFFQNVHRILEGRSDFESRWMWIEWQPREFFTHLPPFAFNWTIKSSAVAVARIRALEKAGERYDAALFNHVLPATFLSRFQRRVPTLFSLDMTPVLLEEFSTWYKGVNASKMFQGMKRKVTGRVYREAYLLLAWSGVVRDSLVNHYGVDPNKIILLPPGIDLQKWSIRRPGSGSGARKQGGVRILFVGGEFLRKGGDIVVGAAQTPEFQHCEFHFVTRSYEGARPSNVVVHDNLHPGTDELLTLYHQADIFVMPTRADFAPTNVICEAMAMELPVITTSIGGLGEVVLDGQTGYVIPRDDHAAFRERLGTLVRSPELRERYGRTARTQAELRFDLRKNAEEAIRVMKLAAER